MPDDRPADRAPLPRRLQLYEEQGGICHACGGSMDPATVVRLNRSGHEVAVHARCKALLRVGCDEHEPLPSLQPPPV